jgi:4-amino-4-deoxy-L-arabinose transferase-like glycosyltransferase
VLNEIQSCWVSRNREALIVLVLTVLAFAVRVHRIDFNSLSEDESAKWTAVQEYRHGHFAGVNSEHPMLPKMLAWASLTVGEGWRRVAATHHWPSMKPEGWLRLPNVIFGALTAAILYLLCRRMMGIPGALAASFFWAVAPLPIALNRLMKEETPLTFFTLLACYWYCRAQQTKGDVSARRWFDLSAISFGLSLASQYIVHLLGLNALAWLFAGKMGLNPNPSRFSYKRFFLVLFLTFILVNPVFLFPSNLHAILQWLHHDGVKHSGYDFDGKLYMNFPSRLFAGVPWFYYLWLLLVKTPIPILIAVVVGGALLFRNRRTLAFCFFLALGVVQLAGLSVSGAKWIRYSLPMLPFLYLAAGYGCNNSRRS